MDEQSKTEESENREKAPVELKAANKNNAGTVMIVDDTPANLALLQSVLVDSGYKVMAFPRGKAALSAAAKRAPDLILLDIDMPEMDGFEVCKHFKNDPELQNIPVIFISALNQTADKVKAFECGGVDYVTKPFQADEVIARVSVHLNLRKRERELKESYEQLQRAEKLRDNLVHMMVHDLRSPLSGVYGFMQLLEMEELPDQTQEYIAEAKYSTEQVLDLVNNILDVNKMESGNMKLNIDSININTLILNEVRKIKSIKEGRLLKTDSIPDNLNISCDQSLLARVIQNLLNNAVAFTNRNEGSIEVRVIEKTEGVRIEIIDNGRGIAPEYIEKIFDKFGQAENRRNSTGLGLTFCRMAVEEHNGSIGVSSEVGVGSTFWLELPKVH